MIDALTSRKLVFSGQNNNAELRAAIDSITSRPRVLDKAPEKYSPISRGVEFTPFGVHSKFMRLYEQKWSERTEQDCTVMLDDRSITCDFKVFLTLDTLMDMSISKSEACATACRELFCAIVNCEKDGRIVKEDTVTVLGETGDYYKNEIVRGILDSMFTGKELVVCTLKSLLGKDYYESIYEKLGAPESVDEMNKVIQRVYKTACTDQTYRVKKHLGRAVNVARYLSDEVKV